MFVSAQKETLSDSELSAKVRTINRSVLVVVVAVVVTVVVFVIIIVVVVDNDDIAVVVIVAFDAVTADTFLFVLHVLALFSVFVVYIFEFSEITIAKNCSYL